VFNLEKLEWMNGQHLKRLPEEERVRRVSEFLARAGGTVARSPEWRARWCARSATGCSTLRTPSATARSRWPTRDRDERVDRGARSPRRAAARALADALRAAPSSTSRALERRRAALAAELGIKAGEMIGMARVALTGRKVSPGIFEVMWLLGASGRSSGCERGARAGRRRLRGRV
jgi:glutamyl-tRNA synthetase